MIVNLRYSMNCPRCQAPLEHNAVCCPACGWMVTSDSPRGMLCEEHPATAVGCCVVCGRPLCPLCAQEHEAKFFCLRPDHRQLYDRYRFLYLAESDFESDLILKNTPDGQLDLKVFPLFRHTSLVLDGRMPGVRLFVRRDQLSEARNHLQLLELIP